MDLLLVPNLNRLRFHRVQQRMFNSIGHFHFLLLNESCHQKIQQLKLTHIPKVPTAEYSRKLKLQKFRPLAINLFELPSKLLFIYRIHKLQLHFHTLDEPMLLPSMDRYEPRILQLFVGFLCFHPFSKSLQPRLNRK